MITKTANSYPIELKILAFLVVLTLVTDLLHAIPSGRQPLLYLFLTGQVIQADSWNPMRLAFEFAQNFPQFSLYDHIFFSEKIKFQYPPSSLLIFNVLPNAENATLTAISWAAVWIQCIATALIGVFLFNEVTRADGSRASDRNPGAAIPVFLLSFASCMTFYLVLQSFRLGQVQTWLNCAFTVSCLFWLIERRLLAGVFVGIVCLFKPQFSIFILWSALRREWAFVAGWCAVVAPAEALSLAVFGLQNHIDYVRVLQFLSARGEAYVPNQSVNGLLNRLLHNGSIDWEEHGFPPYNAAVYVGTITTSLALILSALFLRIAKVRSSIYDYMYAGLIFTMASPIAWEHHYGFLPAIFIALIIGAIAIPMSSLKKIALAAMSAAYILAANDWFFAARFLARTPADVLASYLLFAGLAVLCLLLIIAKMSVGKERAVLP